MTKEELEKEADDYVANINTGICEFEGIETIICDGEGNAIDADSIAKSAYIAGAASREKRIETMKKEIDALIRECSCCKKLSKIHARNLCPSCYRKLKKGGQLTMYKKVWSKE